jgi:hypothetical protein
VILHGDCLEVMAGMEPESVACAHSSVHVESDWAGRTYYFDVCDDCGEVIPGSGRFL